jgi:hypothetical protein
VTNTFEVKGTQLASDIRLGGFTFSRPFIPIDPILPVANIGIVPLQKFALTFDQRNRPVKLVSKDKIIKIPEPRAPRSSQPGAPEPERPVKRAPPPGSLKR